MAPVEPVECPEGSRRVVYAKDQPEYIPLPAIVSPDGVVLTEWELSAEELHTLFVGGRLRLHVLTFGQPLQPVRLEVVAPECGMRDP